MYECNRCGEDFPKPAEKLTVKGRHLGHPDADSEDEYAKVCPHCGSTDFAEGRNTHRRSKMEANSEQSVNYYLLDTLIGATVMAVGNVPSHILEMAMAEHDPERPRATVSFANINTMLAKMGDARESILTFVMPTAVFADLVGDSISNYEWDRIAGVTVYQDVVQAFGRTVIVADVPALIMPAVIEGQLSRYGVLGIGGGSLQALAGTDFHDNRNTKIILGIFHSSIG